MCSIPRPRDAGIDRAVVDACVALLGEVGRHGLTRQQIAERAGVSLPAVSRRYADVESILLAVAKLPPHESHSGPASAQSVRDYLVWLLTRTARGLQQPTTRRAAAELIAAAAGDADIRAAVVSSLAEVRAEGRRWLQYGVADGQIDPAADLDLILDLLTGTAYYRLLWRDEPLTGADIGPLVDLVLNGVKA